MGKEKHQPVGKRALLGAILGRHIDPRLDLLAMQQPEPALEMAGDAPTEATEPATEPVAEPNIEQVNESTAVASMPAGKTTKKSKKQDDEPIAEQPAADAKQHWWRRRHVLNTPAKLTLLALIIMLLIAAPLTGAYTYYNERVLPGLKVAGIVMSGKSRAEVEESIAAQVAGITVTVQNGETQLHPTLADIGVTVDVPATVEAVFAEHRSTNLPQDRFAWWKGADIPLKTNIDEAKLRAYSQSISHETSVPAKDAKLIFAGAGYAITSEADGQGTGIETSVEKLKDGLTSFAPLNLTVDKQVIKPIVTASDLKDVKEEAEAYLNTAIVLSYPGKTFQPTKGEINNWLSVNTDPAKQPYSVTLDSAKVTSYVDSVAKALYIAPVDKKVALNQDQGGAENVIDQGKTGRQLKDQKTLSANVLAAITAKKDLSATLQTDDLPYKTVSYNSYDRYIEADIVKLTLTAYEKGTIVKTFPISAGDRYHPTPPGEYTIYSKTASQTMYGGSKIAGDYFYLPNVQWISWFYGAYSIHGAYWHNLFGIRNTSHGCLNMRNEDAHFIYDWAPVGTKVVIHT